jgi:ubiquinone/menaquinone biosynthesis C-methylase UbiE
MLAEAQRWAAALGRENAWFCQGDAEALPFGAGVFDVVSCKLAFHYFPHPDVAVAEMVRVVKPAGRVVLIDRVSSEDPHQRAYQNRLEKLRTPAKVRVYSESELVAWLDAGGLRVERRATYGETMEVEAWISAAGPDAETAQTIRAMLMREGDPAGLQVRRDGDRWLLTHRTCILVATRR